MNAKEAYDAFLKEAANERSSFVNEKERKLRTIKRLEEEISEINAEKNRVALKLTQLTQTREQREKDIEAREFLIISNYGARQRKEKEDLLKFVEYHRIEVKRLQPEIEQLQKEYYDLKSGIQKIKSEKWSSAAKKAREFITGVNMTPTSYKQQSE